METKAGKSGIVYEPPVIKSWRNEGKFIVSDVVYRGKPGKYMLFEQMTSSMNQEQLAELYEIEKQKGNPHPTDAPLIWAIATKGYEIRNKNPQDSEKLRQFLKTGFRKYPNTLTEIIYNPSGEDKIIHNCKTSEQYSMNGKVIGPDDFIDILPNANVLEQILGTKNVTQINKVSQWINETDTYIYRLNSKPFQKMERIMGFEAGDFRLVLYCFGRDSDSKHPAFQVLKTD